MLKKPVSINNDNIQMLADIINGETTYRLPIVYISKTYYDDNPVNVGLLASKLKGAAHVLVQDSNCTNNKLKILCNEKNEYYGAIGIYISQDGQWDVDAIYIGVQQALIIICWKKLFKLLFNIVIRK